MDNALTRRYAILAGASGALSLGALPALALTEAGARALIGNVVADINRAINSGKTGGALFSDFEKIFTKYADVPTISRSILGPPARGASNAQLRAFSQSLTGYLSRKYGRRFRDFKGGEVEIVGARKLKSFLEVRGLVKAPGSAPYAVSFMVSDRSGRDKFFDMLIEGISLLKAERAEVGAILDRVGGDVDKLTAELRRLG
ncbi:ABC transporter substrate-binding protein [Rhodobacteraceae bacterium]|nr:ABC transporter substrate-binding protein [Paracoccaceae bacterium]